MLQKLSIGLLVTLPLAVVGTASGECVATGYLKGSPIPVYIVQSMHELTDEWDSYVLKYPDTARLSDGSKFLQLRPLSEQCLVGVSSDDGRIESEQLVIQRPCSEFSVGDHMRLVVWRYCVEDFGADPDFYSTLPYRHAYITTDTRYQQALARAVLQTFLHGRTT